MTKSVVKKDDKADQSGRVMPLKNKAGRMVNPGCFVNGTNLILILWKYTKQTAQVSSWPESRRVSNQGTPAGNRSVCLYARLL